MLEEPRCQAKGLSESSDGAQVSFQTWTTLQKLKKKSSKANTSVHLTEITNYTSKRKMGTTLVQPPPFLDQIRAFEYIGGWEERVLSKKGLVEQLLL